MLETQPTFLNLTDAAATKLQEITAEETSPSVGLRVYVYSGGCSEIGRASCRERVSSVV